MPLPPAPSSTDLLPLTAAASSFREPDREKVAFSSLIVGEGALAAECATILLEAGHAVRGIVSANAQVARWAEERGVALIAPGSDVAAAMRAALASHDDEAVDWIFSIVNPHILDADALSVARHGAINYHDAPLPRYAGMHATSWALMNGERRHAVSWHRVVQRVDAGDVLKQVAVDVDPSDSAYTLNTKCYVAATDGFRELVAELAAGTTVVVPQASSARTFFGRLRRPAAAAVVRWDRPATELANLARGLELGPVANPLGRPRLLLEEDAVLAPKLEALETREYAWAADDAPGTVVRADDDVIVVSTAEGLLAIRELRRLDGRALSLRDAATTWALRPGRRLPIPDGEMVARLEARDAASRRREEEWVQRLRVLAPLTLPYVRGAVAEGRAESISIPVPAALRGTLHALIGAADYGAGELLLAGCALYFRRVGDAEGMDVGLVSTAPPLATAAEQRLFNECVPVAAGVDLDAPFAVAAAGFLDAVRVAEARGPVLRDIVTRYPELGALAGRPDALSFPVSVGLSEHDAPSCASPCAGSDLTVLVARDGAAWTWCFDAARLDRSDVVRMMAHVEALVAGAAAAPACAVARLPVMPPDELALVRETWNQTERPFPREATIADLVAAQARRTPAAVALVHDGVELTYAELDARANRLAWRLRELGVGPEARVGVCLPRTPELVVALLAVLKSGGAYVPLDPAYPADRLAFMLADSDAAVVVTERALRDLVSGAARRPVIVDDAEERAALAARGDQPLPATAGPANLAYLIYTSGSTGQPKGVMIEHRSAVAFIAWALDTFTTAELAGVLAATSVCFDLSVFELFVTLSAGGTVILADDALALAGLGDAGRVTLVNTVPSVMAELVRMDGVPASVRTVNLAGEPLATSLVDRLYALGTVERVNDLYGPSEDTTYSTWTLRLQGAPPTIGRPIANSYAYVLDPRGALCPIGVPGELYLGGAGLARGYHARPDLTAERFVPVPFATGLASADAGTARLYRTGDQVRWRGDGVLEYLGRLDFQVKIRGFRIELGEVEARLRSHPHVRDVVVVARSDDGERRLVAYVVADGGGRVSAAELRAHLSQTLPDYMVPAAFVWLPALPLSSNGKVDRKALPAPELDRTTLDRAFVAARTPTEQLLTELWARVLRLDRVGVDDNFFELGGDSILMIQIVSLARRAGLALSARELFRHPTVAELARVVELVAVSEGLAPSSASEAGSAGTLDATTLAQIGVSPSEVEDVYALSPMQQGLLFHSLAGSDDAEYHIQVRFEVRGALDLSEYRRAWRDATGRHPILRTAFVWEGVPQPVQVVLAQAEMPWREEDWRALSEQERTTRLERLLEDDRRTGFELARAPLARVAVVRTGDARYEVVWSFHHLLLDGWSAHAVLHEVSESYAARAAGTTATIERVRPYRDYIAELKREDPDAEAFWRERLAGFATPTSLGIDRRRTDVTGARYARDDLALSAEQSGRLRAFAREHRITLNTVFQGAWAIVLGRYAGSADVVLGATVTTRPSTIDGVDRMVGLFLNSIPVRVRIPTDDGVADWLRALQDVQSESRAHESTPLADIQRWSEIPQGTSLFDSLLVFENYPVAESSSEARAVEFGTPDIIERTHYPLTLAVIPGLRIVVRAMYDATRFTDDAITRLHGHLETVLDAMANAHDARVGDLEIIPAEERRRLLSFGATSLPSLGEETVHARFAAVAASSPDAVALATDDATITYGELARRASGLARVLRAHGAGRGTFVGLAMRPSADLVTAILAILESGAAFVPLDLASPMERLSYVLEDIAAPVVLTQRDVIERLPARDGTSMLVVDEIMSGGMPSGPADPLPRVGRADDPAYVMYTSGSTGRPKGVLVPHRAIVRLVRENNFMRIDADEVFLLLAPVSFDASTLELWGALLNGCRLVVPTSKVPAIERLGALIQEQGVTSIWLTAALFRHVVDSDLGALRPLRQLLAGGDVLPAEQVRRVLEELPALRLINGYGPTENTTFTCCHPVSTQDLNGHGIPIGKPIANTTVYIVDSSMRPVPIGVPGELWTGGAGVALGYLNQPALTAERFVDDPFATGLTSADPSLTSAHPSAARLYRTGDRARWRADGVVEFLGRFDSQVKLRGFRVEPEEVETTLASHPGLRAAVVIVREDRPGEKRLVGYFIPSQGADGGAVDARVLREFLGARLPEYMIPSALVRLDALPVNVNGKVDRRALPAPTLVADEERAAYAPPRTPEEMLLAQIWAEVLRVERVGIHDNYYDLGGDSILSIQIAARARSAGLPVSVSMLVRHHTVADLAGSLEREVALVRADEGPSSGTAPLTPIQRWFFELDPAHRDHWNQAFLFRTLTDLDEGALRGAVESLLGHHDALRLRFAKSGDEWVQRYAPVGEPVPVWVEDLSATPDGDVTGAIARITERAAGSLDIGAGPSLRVVYVRLGDTRGGRLLIAIHHLVVDGISWRILLEDLEAAYGGLVTGARVTLPPKTTSFQQWAADLSARVSSPTLLAEQPYWTAVTEQPLLSLPLDGESDAENTVRDARTLIATLDEQETAELLQRVPAVYATQINDVLLVALADAMEPWAGRGALLLDLEGHGREDIVPDLDLTRTVGWFTSVFPVRLPLGGPVGVGERLKAMKEMLRGVPRRGVGYGSLRYLASDAGLAGSPSPQLVFNYLGQFDQLVADSRLLRFASEDPGPWLAPEGRRRHRLEINSLVLNGRLEFRWTFGTRLHDEETVRRLADAMLAALRAIIAHCRAPDVGGRTASDFPLVTLTQQQVDRLAGDGKLVEEIAPLVPMQSLFLATTASGGDVGFEQWTFDIDGALDVAAFQRAWQLVAARHEILRTAFVGDGLDAPVQVILRQVDVPFVAHDWRAMDEATRSERMRELLAADRAEGFRVDRAPLLRLALVRTGGGESTWTLVWSNHHLLLDRWSWPIVLREVGIIYQSIVGRASPALSPATPWRRYLRWLAERDVGAAESFWRTELDGLAALPLPRLAGANGGEVGGERRLSLTTDESARLARLARERRVTTNTLVSAAWALWLSRRTGSADVVFGVTVAGRPEAVQGIERLVGLCINNVPSRVRVDPTEPLVALLSRLEEQQLAASPHSHVSLLDLQRWSGLPFHQRLFDTLLVFQHHGADDESADWLGASNAVRMGAAETQTNYPLALVVGGKESLTLKLAYQGRFAGAADVDRVLEELRALLTALTALGDAPLGQVLDAMAPLEDALAVSAPERVVTPPRTDVEWVVCQTWAELLGRATVGVTENYFDLGGQSLVATQIVSRVRDAFHLELPISLLFEHPTVEAFARAVVQREATPGRIDRIAAIIRRVEEMTLQELREARIHE